MFSVRIMKKVCKRSAVPQGSRRSGQGTEFGVPRSDDMAFQPWNPEDLDDS